MTIQTEHAEKQVEANNIFCKGKEKVYFKDTWLQSPCL